MNYWIESSWDFEDKNKEYTEHWVVAVNYGDETESITAFPKITHHQITGKKLKVGCPIKSSVDDLLKHINNNLEKNNG